MIVHRDEVELETRVGIHEPWARFADGHGNQFELSRMAKPSHFPPGLTQDPDFNMRVWRIPGIESGDLAIGAGAGGL